jgi:uncharacterized protein (DUF1810 family)
MAHPILGARLLECANIILKIEGKTAMIFSDILII